MRMVKQFRVWGLGFRTSGALEPAHAHDETADGGCEVEVPSTRSQKYLTYKQDI
jgi:hypothetical protein